MSQLSIRRLMQISPALLVTGLVALYLSIHVEMARTEQRINQQTVLSQAVGAMKDTRYYIVQIQQFMTDVGATRQDDAMAEADASLQGALTSLQQLTDLLQTQSTQVQSLKQQVTQLHAAGAAMARAYLTQGLEAGNDLMKGSGGFDETASQLSAALDNLAQELEAQQQAAVAAALDSSAHASVMLVIGCGLLGVFILAVMSSLYRRVIPSLLALTESMRDVASGSHDLTLQLEAKGNDEVAQVASSGWRTG